jgi:putative protease
VRDPAAALASARARVPKPFPGAADVALHLLVRTPEQLSAAIDARPASITLDYLDLYGLRPSLERVRAAGLVARVASPRVLKPNEERIVSFLQKLGVPILVRSTGLLRTLSARAHPPLVGDCSLNAANVLTAETFLTLGLERITPAHDLDAVQVAQFAESLGGERVEVVAYHHLPVFHTENCVFCCFLSDGTSYRDCGRPCDRHRVALRDVTGREHPVMADVGCRNTVFGAQAQEASRRLDAWRVSGVRHLRLEFAHESADQVTKVAEAFRAYTEGGFVQALDLGRETGTLYEHTLGHAHHDHMICLDCGRIYESCGRSQ